MFYSDYKIFILRFTNGLLILESMMKLCFLFSTSYKKGLKTF